MSFIDRFYAYFHAKKKVELSSEIRKRIEPIIFNKCGKGRIEYEEFTGGEDGAYAHCGNCGAGHEVSFKLYKALKMLNGTMRSVKKCQDVICLDCGGMTANIIFKLT